MFQKPISPLLRVWYKWKMLRLPWRRQFLVGLDLQGNTYWEFLDRGSPLPSSTASASASANRIRWRRMVRCPRGVHHADVVVPPAWHQWLRHTRADPPSLAEQAADVARQERIKVLAAQADARWEAKPRLTDAPGGAAAAGRASFLGVRQPITQTDAKGGPGAARDKRGVGRAAEKEEGEEEVEGGTVAVNGGVGARDEEAVRLREETWKRMQEEASAKEQEEKKAATGPDPWRQARGGPGETWQPKAWEPTAQPKKP
ncbi:hypothetical protein VTK56DRAFT_2673 [Thermocarpiscus australiensis]